MTRNSNRWLSVLALVFGGVVVLASGWRSANSAAEAPATNSLAQNFQAEHEIGRKFHVDPNELPAPKVGTIVTNRSLTVPFSGQTLQVPQGYLPVESGTGSGTRFQ